MKTRLRQERIPPWWETSRYRDLDQLTTTGWYEQLLARVECAKRIYIGKLFQGADIAEEAEAISNFLISISRKPILDRQSIDEFTFGSLTRVYEGMENSSLVHELTLGELVELHQKIPPELAHELARRVDFIGVRKLRPWPSKFYPNDPVGVHSADFPSLLTIDLDLPRKALEEQFSTWLSQAKRLRSARRRQSRPGKVERWASDGLLQRLDLELWARSVKAKPTERDLAFAIFNDGSKISSIRSVTKLAMAVLDESDRGKALMARLRAMVMLDLHQQRASRSLPKRRNSQLSDLS